MFSVLMGFMSDRQSDQDSSSDRTDIEVSFANIMSFRFALLGFYQNPVPNTPEFDMTFL